MTRPREGSPPSDPLFELKQRTCQARAVSRGCPVSHRSTPTSAGTPRRPATRLRVSGLSPKMFSGTCPCSCGPPHPRTWQPRGASGGERSRRSSARWVCKTRSPPSLKRTSISTRASLGLLPPKNHRNCRLVVPGLRQGCFVLDLPMLPKRGESQRKVGLRARQGPFLTCVSSRQISVRLPTHR